MWLPLALADIFAALVNLMRPWLRDPDALKPPSRADTLAAWCLPMLSRSFAADEREREAFALYNAVKNMADKQGAAASRRLNGGGRANG